MGLFGGGSTSNSYIKRPGYIQDMINSLSDQVGKTQTGAYTPEQFADLTTEQQTALADMLNGNQFQSYYDKLNQSGQSGIDTVNSAYEQLANLKPVTSEDITNTADQLLDRTGTENLIKAQNQQLEAQQATDVNPNIAQQLNAFGAPAFGSMSRLAKDRAAASLATSEQNAASDITEQAFQNARSEASSLLSGNLANKRGVLNSLISSGQQQASNLNTSAQLSQQSYQDRLNAIQQQQQNLANQNDINYQNQTLAQNWKYNDWNNRMNEAGALSDLYGQKVTTKTSGGSNLLGGALSVAGGVAGAYFGGPAGAAIGSQLGGMAGSALAS